MYILCWIGDFVN